MHSVTPLVRMPARDPADAYIAGSKDEPTGANLLAEFYSIGKLEEATQDGQEWAVISDANRKFTVFPPCQVIDLRR